MKYFGGWEFPEGGNKTECDEWKPFVRRRAISSRVLAVARTRIEGAWAAYCDAVPGLNHDNEWRKVLEEGAKMDKDTAVAIFPMFKGVPYAW
jgi:hypothetical protein